MKKKLLTIFIIIVLIISGIINCKSPAETDNTTDPGKGALSLKFRLPKYRGTAWNKGDSKVIDPLTSYVQIYLDTIQFFDIPLSSGTYTAGSLLTEAQWEIQLPVPASSYDSIQVVLTAADHTPLTAGTAYNVVIKPLGKTALSIGCLPVTYLPVTTDNTPLNGTVAAARITYYSFDYIANADYRITLTTGSGTPDLYVFNNQGALIKAKYNAGLSTTLDFSSPNAGMFFLGIYGYNTQADFAVAVSITNYAPVIVTETELSAYTGTTINFDASATSDTDGNTVSFSWDFGDNSAANGAVVTHTYAKAGTYQAQLTVTDNDGGQAAAIVVVTVLDDVGIAYPLITEYYHGDMNSNIAVELYNPTLNSISLACWVLQSSDNLNSKFIFSESVQIEPGQYLVCVSESFLENYTTAPDFKYQSFNHFSSIYDYISLSDDTGKCIDYVEFDTAEYPFFIRPEGAEWSAAAGSLTLSDNDISRKIPLADTNSAADWKSTYATIGLPTDTQAATNVMVLCY